MFTTSHRSSKGRKKKVSLSCIQNLIVGASFTWLLAFFNKANFDFVRLSFTFTPFFNFFFALWSVPECNDPKDVALFICWFIQIIRSSPLQYLLENTERYLNKWWYWYRMYQIGFTSATLIFNKHFICFLNSGFMGPGVNAILGPTGSGKTT